MIASTRTRVRRDGFTLIELLVVIAIIAVLAGLLIPAVMKAREASNRAVCVNNMNQLGTAIQHYAEHNNKYPTGGEGTNFAAAPVPGTVFDTCSVFTQLLPFLDVANLADAMDTGLSYNDPNQRLTADGLPAAKHVIPSLLCPSNSLRPATGLDPAGYGYTDYGPTVYTDIDPITGVRNKYTRVVGGLRFGNLKDRSGNLLPSGSQGADPTRDIRDGASCTIAIAEDSGRGALADNANHAYQSPYADPVVAGAERSFWRWAEPDCGFGVSGNAAADAHALASVAGQPDGTKSTFPGTIHAINNTAQPLGGGTPSATPPAAADQTAGICPWGLGYMDPANSFKGNNNCGPNDEIFSFHGGGANVLFLDGSVKFLSQDIRPTVLRGLVSAAEGTSPTQGADY